MRAEAYQSFSESWEERATIRTRPRRRLEDDEKLIFPASRQPLVMSATFMQECSHLQHFVLVQSLYKFINDVVIFETEIVDKTARSIAKDNFAIRFPFACRYDAMTVVVDEDYHALVAMDYMQQTLELTGIEPITLPAEIELSRSIPKALAMAPAHLKAAVELIYIRDRTLDLARLELARRAGRQRRRAPTGRGQADRPRGPGRRRHRPSRGAQRPEPRPDHQPARIRPRPDESLQPCRRPHQAAHGA